MIAGRDRHLDAGAGPPVKARADGEHDPCCGGGSFVPGGTTRPDWRIRSGSSSLITTRSKRGRSCCRISGRLDAARDAGSVRGDDRSADALGPIRREARLRRPAQLCRTALHEDPGELEGVDVAIVGAPPTTSFRPSRNALRAARDPRRRLPAGAPPGAGIDAFAALRVIDYGDAAVLPATRSPPCGDRAHGRRGRRRRRYSRRARRRPLDRRARHPSRRRAARTGRPGPLRRPHRHRGDGLRRRRSHGTPMYTWSSRGSSIPPATCRSACADTGRASTSSPGSASTGSPRSSCTTSARFRSRRSSGGPCGVVGSGPAFLSIDIDVLDPSSRPAPGRPNRAAWTSLS